MKSSLDSQKGFALLTVLTIVALIAMVASQLLYEQHTGIKRSSHMLHQAQSFSVNWGIEAWVKEGLELDRKSNQTDHLNELWAKPLGPIPYEGGTLSGQLFDLQARINLNNMTETDVAQRQIWQAILQRYSQQHDLPLGFVDLVTDWVDTDDQASPLGAESNQYLLKEPAYSAANQPLVMLSELTMLQGLEALKTTQWQAVEENLTTLPEVVKINVNSASHAVLMALAVWITDDIAEKWLKVRDNKPAEITDDFRNFLVAETGFNPSDVLTDLPNWLISAKSEYFLLKSQVSFGDSDEAISAIFSRKTNKDVQLVQRWLSVTETLE